MDGKPKGRAIGKIASQHAVLGSRRVDGQAREGSGRATGNERVSRTSPEPRHLFQVTGASSFLGRALSARLSAGASRAGERALAFTTFV